MPSPWLPKLYSFADLSCQFLTFHLRHQPSSLHCALCHRLVVRKPAPSPTSTFRRLQAGAASNPSTAPPHTTPNRASQRRQSMSEPRVSSEHRHPPHPVPRTPSQGHRQPCAQPTWQNAPRRPGRQTILGHECNTGSSTGPAERTLAADRNPFVCQSAWAADTQT